MRFFVDVLGMSITSRREADGKLQQVWLDRGTQLVAASDDTGIGLPDHLGISVQDFKCTLAKMLAYEGVHSADGKPEKW
ncbi:VOC family protein [Succinivibrio dextrinosolvens]|uniref:VOC family protein n=1 Tax=Succinivibrio dextrinosolvens TaxID=83771 RepID=UPI0012DFC93E|nr:hypothetical protein [Succinivibrio dextrinosolvens]